MANECPIEYINMTINTTNERIKEANTRETLNGIKMGIITQIKDKSNAVNVNTNDLYKNHTLFKTNAQNLDCVNRLLNLRQIIKDKETGIEAEDARKAKEKAAAEARAEQLRKLVEESKKVREDAEAARKINEYQELQTQIYNFTSVDGIQEKKYVNIETPNISSSSIPPNTVLTINTLIIPSNITDILLTNLNNYLSFLRETKGGSVRVYVRFRDITERSGLEDTTTKCLESYKTDQNLFHGTFGGTNNIYDNNTFYTTLTNGDKTSNIEALNIADDILNKDTDTLIMTYGYSGTGKTYTLYGDKLYKTPGSMNGIVQNVISDLNKIDSKAQVSIDKAFVLYKGDTTIGAKTEAKDFYNPIKNNSEKGSYTEFTINKTGSIDKQLSEIQTKMGPYIFWTPNNPSSSRGHLIIIFKVQFQKDGKDKIGYFTVVDFAGLEDTNYIYKNVISLTNTTLENFFNNRDKTYLNPQTTTIYPKESNANYNDNYYNTDPDFKSQFFKKIKGADFVHPIYSIKDDELKRGVESISIPDNIQRRSYNNEILNKYKRIKYIYNRLEEGFFINDSLKKLRWFLQPNSITESGRTDQFQKGIDGLTADIRNILTNIRNHFLTPEELKEQLRDNTINKNTRFVMLFTFKNYIKADICEYYKQSLTFAKSISSKSKTASGGRGIHKRVSKKAEEKRPKTKRTPKVRG